MPAAIASSVRFRQAALPVTCRFAVPAAGTDGPFIFGLSCQLSSWSGWVGGLRARARGEGEGEGDGTWLAMWTGGDDRSAAWLTLSGCPSMGVRRTGPRVPRRTRRCWTAAAQAGPAWRSASLSRAAPCSRPSSCVRSPSQRDPLVGRRPRRPARRLHHKGLSGNARGHRPSPRMAVASADVTRPGSWPLAD
jgi:hypothetical protein